jgi:hypothetical protein
MMNPNAPIASALPPDSPVPVLLDAGETWRQTMPAPVSDVAEMPPSNTDRAKTITVVLESIIARNGYPHGGINE